ncbi:acyl-CoA synthetase, AMP-forming [Geobacter metallireducens GS-15]|uniref:Acyl-CoA synthetase, AMP-forming n=1 Tax=Geobacter metallireducens (strain ATCC 53774 / DSM 7210 / GS-15) TaxID=269799 RepID=Q39TF1_GEOMG|nr:AMP-binding protein [Geobacter metallireducens]ABB32473.1 acyl-CoA synthetase, AMP-forming [Geobacter metallireducens GS-15]
MLLKEIFNRGPKLFPTKSAIIDGDRRFTYREAGDRWNRLANVLVDCGLKKGDCLGFLLMNCAEIIDAYAAGAKAGVAVGGVNYRLAPEGIKKVIEDMGCRVLLVGAEFVDTINSLRPHLPFLETCISVGTKVTGMHEYESIIAKASTMEPDVSTSGEDLAHIIYTTGTTGAPKGAMATRQIAMNRISSELIELYVDVDDRFLNVFPLFHVGFYTSLAFLSRGATVAILREWDPQKFCSSVQDYKINKTNLAPVVVNFLVNWADAAKYDLNSLQLIKYGAAPMPMETLKKAMKLLPDCKFTQCYGCSESFGVVYLRPEEHAAALNGSSESVRRMGSCGREAAFCIVRVVNEKGQDVKPGEVGEILIGGGLVMTGYLNKPEETAEAIRSGWLHTKDMAMVDDEGYIYLVDRKAFMIITGGENVYPAQVENVLHDHPKIAEVAVIGVQDDTWGEAVKAVVVPKKGEILTEEEVIEFCRPRMANYAKPKTVVFTDALLHTATGKIDKLALKKKYESSKLKC